MFVDRMVICIDTAVFCVEDVYTRGVPGCKIM